MGSKNFSDRAVSKNDGRLVHDPKLVNDDSPKHKYFPALMPLHSELARILFYWSHRLPGIRLLLAKKDVADAFKWLWLLAECAGVFSCEFKPGDAGLESGLICLWLSLNLGWRGGARILRRVWHSHPSITLKLCPRKPGLERHDPI